MLARLVPAAQAQATALSGTPLAANSLQALAYLAVAQRLIDPAAQPPAAVRGMVTAAA